MKTLLIICEAGAWRSKCLAKEINKKFKQKEIKTKIINAGFRNKENNPYINLPKFLAYMFMTPLTQELIDKSSQIIIAAPEMYSKIKREFKIPRERTINYNIEDYKSVFDLLPFFNHKFKKIIKDYAKLYINKHHRIYQEAIPQLTY